VAAQNLTTAPSCVGKPGIAHEKYFLKKAAPSFLFYGNSCHFMKIPKDGN
jgi:hypothetical protein